MRKAASIGTELIAYVRVDENITAGNGWPAVFSHLRLVELPLSAL